MKYVKTKYINKLVITTDLQGEAVDICPPKLFFCTAADFEKKKKKKSDKGIILKIIRRKNKDNKNDLDVDVNILYRNIL